MLIIIIIKLNSFWLSLLLYVNVIAAINIMRIILLVYILINTRDVIFFISI